MNRNIFPLLITILFSLSVSAQNNDFIYGLFQNTGPEVILNGKSSHTAFNGGIYSPRYGSIDINLDGILDIISLDYEDNKSSVYLGNGDPLDPIYTFEPNLNTAIPPSFQWLVTLDFNGDGLMDLFTADNAGGVLAYRNESKPNDREVKFQLVFKKPLKYFDSEFNRKLFITVLPTDIPNFSDVDGDGDIDLLTFDSGENVVYYQNQSMEKYGHKDSIDYIVATYCWGRFTEASNGNDIIFAPHCFLYLNGKDPGSSMLTIDMDNDGDKDVLLSDQGSPGVLSLENGWNPNDPNGHHRDTIISASKNFPSNSKSIDIKSFPILNYLDVNFDGKMDIIASVGNRKYDYTEKSTWYYENQATQEIPSFVYKQNDFLQEKSIDFGKYSFPSFFDEDGDGDQDLFVASPVLYKDSIFDKSFYKLNHYENIGDSIKPIFQLVTNDFLNLKQEEHLYFSPFFGDLNNDNSVDMLLGLEDGTVICYYNSAKPSEKALFSTAPIIIEDIKVLSYAAPCIVDINKDQVNDLIIGSSDGSLTYFEGIGSDEFKKGIEQWKGIDESENNRFGYSVPRFADINKNYSGQELVIGSNYNGLSLYEFESNENLATKIEPIFLRNDPENPEKMEFIQKNVGLRTSPAILKGYSLDGEKTLPHIILGNKKGGLTYFEAVKKQKVSIGLLHETESTFRLFPNPTASSFTVKFRIQDINIKSYSIYDIHGRKQINVNLWTNTEVNCSQLSAGLYLVLIEDSNGDIGQQKLIIR